MFLPSHNWHLKQPSFQRLTSKSLQFEVKIFFFNSSMHCVNSKNMVCEHESFNFDPLLSIFFFFKCPLFDQEGCYFQKYWENHI